MKLFFAFICFFDAIGVT